MENVREENPDSIVHDYCVTDKARIKFINDYSSSELLNQLGIDLKYLVGHSF